MNFWVLAVNVGYAMFGVALTLTAMYASFRLFDRMTWFDTCRHLHDGNVAVGVMVAGMCIGIGCAVGLTIGLGLN